MLTPRTFVMINVFISYSHDSDEHRERVLGLSERLRADGIPTLLDRYVGMGSPPEGWPRWMLNGLDAASHVLCVCTGIYYRRFRGLEVPGRGRGVDWEGALITQALYDWRSVSNKFIPVLLDQTGKDCVPEPLRTQTSYVVDSEAGYQALYDALLNQNGVEPGPIGDPKRTSRATGRPLTFGAASDAGGAVARSSPALAIWREKLEFLLVEEAVTVDPAMKFRLKHLLREAQDKLHALEGGS
jgi:hypothetical protein